MYLAHRRNQGSWISQKIKPCDKYDVSNLRLPEQENSVELLVADDLFDSYKDIFPGIRKDIEGKTLQNFYKNISRRKETYYLFYTCRSWRTQLERWKCLYY